MRLVRSLAPYAALIAAVGLAGAVAVLVTLPARAQTCPDPTPTAVTVSAVPIVVTSTTDDYFVLYASFDVDGTEVEFPVAVVRGEAGTTTLEENVEALPADRYRVEKYAVSDPADVDGDCVDDITELDNLGSMNPVNSSPAMALGDGAVVIPDRSTFEAISVGFNYFGYDGRYLKFIIDGLETDQPRLYFVNSATYPTHHIFLESRGLDPREVVSGDLAYHPDLAARDGSLGVYYFWIDNLYYFESAALIYTLLAANMPVVEENLFLFVQNVMLQTYQQELPVYEASRIDRLFQSDIYGESDFLALNTGEGYGLLRVLEADERPSPRDVVIYEALPNELPRVAGIISTVPQTPLSHVNLRAVQDSIPNAFVRDVLDEPGVASLVGGFVRYEVTERGWELRAATLDEVNDHYESSRPTETQTPERDLSVTEITPLDQIGFDDWTAFGVKAANLAVLRTLGFPEGTVPDGFAIPFYFYDEFMQQPLGQETVFGKGSAPDEEKLTLAADTTLIEAVEAILAHPKFQIDLDIQDEMLDDLRDAIKDAASPQWIIDALTAMHATYPAGQSLRYRSSTNNEDLPGFNGAGLYDSKTQHPEETEDDGSTSRSSRCWPACGPSGRSRNGSFTASTTLRRRWECWSIPTSPMS